MTDQAPDGTPRPGQGDTRPGHGDAEAEPSRDALRARIAELEDQRLRALADADNVRKRCSRDIERARSEERARVAADWLPVLDNLDLALAHAGADPGAIIDGVRTVRDQAAGVLQRLGFARRDDLGAVFDPSRHDAIGSRAGTDAPAGTVVEVLRPAYGESDHQLRPALVVVAKDG
jgi:molecular chaperone GrpE